MDYSKKLLKFLLEQEIKKGRLPLDPSSIKRDYPHKIKEFAREVGGDEKEVSRLFSEVIIEILDDAREAYNVASKLA